MGMTRNDVTVNFKGGVTCNNSKQLHQACSVVIKVYSNFAIITIGATELPIPEEVRFSLNGTTYQNNSLVTLEDIGESDAALLCLTNATDCCRPPYAGAMEGVRGNWFFPNGTTVPNETDNSTTNEPWNFYSTRGNMTVLLHRRRGGEEGVYCCVVPDASNVTQTLYIGVYTENIGEWCMYTTVAFKCSCCWKVNFNHIRVHL